MRFIDTNIFVRLLTRDDAEKAEACAQLFEQAEQGRLEITTSESVVAEVVFVLSSKRLYNLPRTQIQTALRYLLSLAGMKIPNPQLYLRALDLYATHNIDFEDALSVAHVERQGIAELVSYDKGFDRIGAVTRVEP